MEGDSGPYIMYTNARALSILEKTDTTKYDHSSLNIDTFNDVEIELVKHLYKYNDIVSISTKRYSPNFICSYLYELSQLFNKFYNEEVILHENEKILEKKLAITKSVQLVLVNGLYLLGIEAPQRM
jgi:arginyl-tRNA synthetase